MPGQVGIPRTLTLFGNHQLWSEHLSEVLVNAGVSTGARLKLRCLVDPKAPVHGYQPRVESRVMSWACSYSVAKVHPLLVVARCPRLDVRCHQQFVARNGPRGKPAETAAMGEILQDLLGESVLANANFMFCHPGCVFIAGQQTCSSFGGPNFKDGVKCLLSGKLFLPEQIKVMDAFQGEEVRQTIWADPHIPSSQNHPVVEMGKLLRFRGHLDKEPPLVRSGIGAGAIQVHHLVVDRPRRPDKQLSQVMQDLWRPMHGPTPIAMRVHDKEEPVAQDRLNRRKRLLARSRLAAEYPSPLRSGLLDCEVEVVTQRSHAANVAGH